MYILFRLLPIIVLAFITTHAKENLVMVFGCFDLLHEGHKNFLYQASQHGAVIAVVTPDSIISKLKKRNPIECQETRLKNVQKCEYVNKAILGDENLGSYQIFQKFSIDLICLGYDQQGLYNDLKMRMTRGQITQIPIVFLEPYQEHVYHTTLIREKLQL
jgi:cytidyltransferase-like protein